MGDHRDVPAEGQPGESDGAKDAKGRHHRAGEEGGGAAAFEEGLGEAEAVFIGEAPAANQLRIVGQAA